MLHKHLHCEAMSKSDMPWHDTSYLMNAVSYEISFSNVVLKLCRCVSENWGTRASARRVIGASRSGILPASNSQMLMSILQIMTNTLTR